MAKKHDKKQSGRKGREPSFRSFSFVAFREDEAPLAAAGAEVGPADEGDEAPDSYAFTDYDDEGPSPAPPRVSPLEGRARSLFVPDEATASPYEAEGAVGLDIESETALDLAEIGPTEPLPIPGFGDEPDAPAAPPATGSEPAREDPAALEARIQGLEQELDRLLRLRDGGAPRVAPAAPAPRPAPPPRAQAEARDAEPPVRATDEDGFDPAFEESVLPLLDFLCERYFRVEALDLGHVPSAGKCLLVANHGGGRVPLDGLVLRSVLRLYHPASRSLRWLSEDAVHHLPFVGVSMARLGAVRACPENGERLLARGDLALVFPEGEKGLGKTRADRYRLQRFGRGGFVRLALRTGAPLVPVAVLGSEETPAVNVALDPLLRLFGLGGGPVARLAARGALSWLPAPAKWRIRFGEPIRLDAWGPEAASDEVLVARVAADVRGRIQGMLDELGRGRRGVFLG